MATLPHQPPPIWQQAVRAAPATPLLCAALFGMMALYGPALQVIGNLRYIEILIIVIAALNLRRIFLYADDITLRLIQLFLLTAVCQLVSDIVNGAATDGTIKRVGTYLIFIPVILGMKFLSANDFTRMRWIFFGYALSWIFIYIVGTSAAPLYQENPWRLGLGWAGSFALCVLFTYRSNASLAMGGLLLLLAAGHVVLGSRAIAIFTLMAGLGSIWAALRGAAEPPRIALRRVIAILCGILLAGFLLYQALIAATNAGILPGDVQKRMQMQLASPYGLAAAARPETASAISAIGRRPILGWGSTGYDNDIWGYYIDIQNSSYLGRGDYSIIYEQAFNQEWDLGLPSHSHVFGAWVDAGVFASLSWFAVLLLASYVLIGALGWNSALTPLLLFVSGTTIWDVLFSPGPHRMDMAVRFVILTYAASRMRTSWKEASVERPAPA